jgi:hypothetical protein
MLETGALSEDPGVTMVEATSELVETQSMGLPNSRWT